MVPIHWLKREMERLKEICNKIKGKILQQPLLRIKMMNHDSNMIAKTMKHNTKKTQEVPRQNRIILTSHLTGILKILVNITLYLPSIKFFET